MQILIGRHDTVVCAGASSTVSAFPVISVFYVWVHLLSFVFVVSCRNCTLPSHLSPCSTSDHPDEQTKKKGDTTRLDSIWARRARNQNRSSKCKDSKRKKKKTGTHDSLKNTWLLQLLIVFIFFFFTLLTSTFLTSWKDKSYKGNKKKLERGVTHQRSCPLLYLICFVF